MSLLISGYPYVRESFFKTFLDYPQKAFFLLPSAWKIKGGKVTYYPPKRDNLITTKAFFYHSNYPLIGGFLKGWVPLFPFHLLRMIGKIELVYTATEPILLSTLYNGFWSKIMGKKHVIFTWENVPLESKLKGLKGFIQRIILRLNLAFCDGIICGNKKAEEIFKRLTNKPIAVIPLSGTDPDFFKPTHDKKFLDKYNMQGKLIFSFVGSISYRKGIHLILEAFEEVNEKFNAGLFIVGSGEYEDQISQKIKDLNLTNVVRIPWISHEDLRNLLDASDVFLYPSLAHGGWEEQFGYSMAEASLMELPVISSRSGSIEDVILDNQTGVLVEPENKDQLQEAMLRLAADDSLRKALGVSGRKFISENFSHKIIAQKYYDFFQSL